MMCLMDGHCMNWIKKVLCWVGFHSWKKWYSYPNGLEPDKQFIERCMWCLHARWVQCHCADCEKKRKEAKDGS
jgi:hypothetical protein